MTTRRRFLGTASFTVAGSMLLQALPTSLSLAAATGSMLKRPIPSSSERVPVIGMGTSGSFEVSQGGAEYEALKDVLKRFFAGGASLIDTAPTYSNAEDNLGPLLAGGGYRKQCFLATKLSGVSGREAGFAQFASTLKRLQTDKVELLQVHNLRDWKTQIEVARELKKQGKVRYVGVTHYLDSAHDELAEVVRATKPDFLQINHSVTNRGIEKRVLPLAQELGVAVLTNRNFNDGALFRQVQGKSLPAWAAEAGVTSWAQMFLKYSLSFEAVTAVIPATGKPERQSDNLQAGFGPLLTVKQREEVVALVG
ncbi:MAG TPA: aldo/keto reductase [Povalibacter sp.]|uniref:aldo/keto reductase n=1 Tax=Povalibacter sp. TaxID=1962978 RepID=UPI002B9D85E0|nr:aldo/keto reductase [Povalibacter sp.]HMN46169.1 aldo/keto reductase [Povalibacter sp.]